MESPVKARTSEYATVDEESVESAAGTDVTLAPRMLLAARMMLMVLLVGVAWMTVEFKGDSMQVDLSSPVGPARKIVPGNAGPWGELEYVRINIERPDELIPNVPMPPPAARWFFSGMNRGQLDQFLALIPVSEEVRRAMLTPERIEQTTEGVWVTPGDEIIWGLDRKQREKIYAVLAEASQNTVYHMPHAFLPESLDGILNQSGLQPETVSLVKQLLYMRGHSVCFSDLETVIRRVNSQSETRRLIKTLSRQTTLLVKLRVRSDTDVDKLAHYWGQSGRSKDIKALLESLTKTSKSTTVDVVHLLSPVGRRLLYTYPFPQASDISGPNCFWTSFAYFDRETNPTFMDLPEAAKLLQNDYDPIQGAPNYGDIVMLISPQNGIVHVAVYIADDIVFTKNGGHYSQPWIFMRLDEMIASYPSATPLQIGYARRKPKAS